MNLFEIHGDEWRPRAIETEGKDRQGERRLPSGRRRRGSSTLLRGACYAFPVNLTGVIEPVVHFFSLSLFSPVDERQRWTLIWERGKRIRRWRVRAFRVCRARSFSERRVRSHASNCKWCTCSSHMSKTNCSWPIRLGHLMPSEFLAPGKGFFSHEPNLGTALPPVSFTFPRWDNACMHASNEFRNFRIRFF